VEKKAHFPVFTRKRNMSLKRKNLQRAKGQTKKIEGNARSKPEPRHCQRRRDPCPKGGGSKRSNGPKTQTRHSQKRTGNIHLSDANLKKRRRKETHYLTFHKRKKETNTKISSLSLSHGKKTAGKDRAQEATLKKEECCGCLPETKQLDHQKKKECP